MAEAAWVRIQRKTFSRWCNNYLSQRQLGIENLDTDLSDGIALHNLLEILSNETIQPKPKINPKLKVQKVENINTCLRYVKSKDIKLVGIGAEDVHDGKTNLILGLIWTLILRFQIEKFEEEPDGHTSAKQALLDWCNKVLNPQGIIVTNFKDSWSDGRAFCGLVNALEPGTVDLASRTADMSEENLNLAFDSAQQLFQFPKVLDAVDVMESPDELSNMTYVSYFRAFLAANTADPTKSYAEGIGLVEATTGKPATYTVFTVNEEGEPAKRGGANIKGFLADETGKEIMKVKVKDNLNGTYECTYVPKLPGVFILHVQIGKNDIRDSPFKPLIKPGEPKAGKCVAFGPGIEGAVAGEVAKFTVQSKDVSGNNLTSGGFHVHGAIQSSGGDIPIVVVDNQDGTYTCSYSPITAGPCALNVNITTDTDGSAPIQNSPFKVHVAPGHPSAKFTEATGPGTKGATAGNEAPVLVHCKDQFGNPLKSGGAPVSGILSLLNDQTMIPLKVIDNENGTYSLNYIPEKAGNYELQLLLDNQPIKDSPISLTVKPGLPDLLNFEWDGLELDGNGNRILVAGIPDTFSVTSKDSFGNPLNNGGLKIEGSLKGPESVPVLCADNGDGTYTVSYRPTAVGNYSLSVLVGNQPLGGGKKNPIPMVVIPAPTSGAHSIATGDGVEEAQVGLNNVFVIQSRDEFDNDVTLGGANVGGSLVHEDSNVQVPLIVQDNGDGTYTCTYPDLTKSGNYTLTPTVNGEPIMDAPFNLSVMPGGTNSENTSISFPDHNVAGLPGIKVQLRDDHGNLQKKGGDKVRAHLLPLTAREVSAKDNGDGTYAVDYPPNIRGDVEVKVKVNGKYAPCGPFQVALEDNPLPEEIQKEVQELLPSTGAIFNSLLKDASPQDRIALLEELKAISKGKRLPPAPLAPVTTKESKTGEQKIVKPKRDVRKGTTNPVKARAEIAEKAVEEKIKEEAKSAEAPPTATAAKPYRPPGAFAMPGLGSIGAQAALQQREKRAAQSAGQLGELEAVQGKAVEAEELKPETAPAKGATKAPAYGFGAFNVEETRSKLKKANS